MGVPMPTGKQYAVTWAVREAHGGMTAAILDRSSMFVRHWGVTVDVLTFDDYVEYPQLQRRLLRDRKIIPGVRIMNLWDWLRETELVSFRTVTARHVPLSPHRDAREVKVNGRLALRELRDADGAIVATDRYRSDGTLLATDRRHMPKTMFSKGKGITLYDSVGEPQQWFRTGGELYRYWLDQISREMPAFFIVDSKTSARFMADYRRPTATTIHVVHGAHLTSNGDLTPARKQTFMELDAFDRVVFLTEGQRQEAADQLSPDRARLSVIPNAVHPVPKSVTPRQRGRAVMLASLTPRKRVDHAIQAIAQAARSEEVTLDIFGEGSERSKLEQIIIKLGVTDRVTLRGAHPDAAEAFRTADISLLTSESEGLPLVLLESMAAGCIPMSYDIRYGPGDVIDDGTNGYLVEPADVAALAAQIVFHARDTKERTDKMRAAARITAHQYSPVLTTGKWASELHDALTIAPNRFRAIRRLKRLTRRLILGAHR